MSDQGSDTFDVLLLHQRALSRWDNEGGAGPCGPLANPSSAEFCPPVPKMGEAELVTLHIRVIGLENLVIALLATASDGQLRLARDMSSYITPRPGFTQHPLTTSAASHMVDLIERATRFRSGERSE